MSDIDAKKNELKEEIEKLKYEFKVELPKIIATARAYGDLKENAEYHAARERQSFVKAKIAQLADRLGKLSELNIDDISVDRVGFGSQVTVIDLDSDDDIIFTIVSPEDVNPSEGKISGSSPFGAALINKSVGDKVEVNIPAGNRKYYIEKLKTIHGKEFIKKYQ